jgi:hypothetical protein
MDVHKKIEKVYRLADRCQVTSAIPVVFVDLEYRISGIEVIIQRKYTFSSILLLPPTSDDIGTDGIPKTDLPHCNPCYEQGIPIWNKSLIIKKAEQ